MNTEKTPLVQKLILGVLTLILICLVVLIAQNRSKPTASAPEVSATADLPAAPASVEEEKPVPAPQENRTSPRPMTRPAESTPASAVPAVAAAGEFVPLPPVIPPPPHTTLVNPVGRQPVDIVVRPHGAVLKSGLCGRVRLEGAPPPEVPIGMDAACSRLNEQPVTTRHYVVGPEGGLANVLVYIKDGLPSHHSPPPVNAATVTVARCSFEPYVVGVLAGQKVNFSNGDSLLHTFHGTSKQNPEFSFSLGRRGQTRQRAFERPEIFIRIKCDVHPWEFAYLGVIAHPFFAVTDANGVFCLPAGLPHGRYVLAAVHLKAGETLREIIVSDEDTNAIELALTVPRRP